jgi:acetyl-CoA synthetase/medium-chain acyl-CoA synthetase
VVGNWAQDANKLAMLWVNQYNEVEQITFAQFAERSSRAANAFASAGISKGERVLLMLPRIPEWWEAALGLFKLGAIPIPCTTLLTPKDLQFRSEIAEPLAIVTDREGAAKFDQVHEQCPSVRVSILAEHTHAGAERAGWQNYQTMLRDASPDFTGEKTRSDDPCLIYFTSGTVGYPKMVLHSHARIHRGRAGSSRQLSASTRMTPVSSPSVVHSS